VRSQLTAIYAIVFAVVGLAGSTAVAGPNDITLQRFGTCTNPPGCISVDQDETGFRNLARDLGLVFVPKGLVTAETLGQAGFSFQIDQNFSIVDNSQDYWVRGNVNGEPSGTLATTQVHIRKGLPFSFEIGAILTALWNSQLAAVGTELRWALHEDYLWPVPDLAVRGFVNTVVGSPQLSLTVTGFDIIASIPIGVGNVMNVTPFAGYNMSIIISASRLIDATPADPTPPFEDLSDPSQSNFPEFVFGVENEIVSQGIGGIRFQFALLNVLMQITASSHVQTYSFSVGLDF